MPSSTNPDKKTRFPAEWESQSAVMLTWPHARSDWASLMDEIEPVYTSMCQAISEQETCIINCYDETVRKLVETLLNEHAVNLANCKLVFCPTNDTWCRDYGPLTTLADSKAVLNDFIFNSWGNKYESDLDNAVSLSLQQQGIFGKQLFIEHDLVLEGGSIETDGAGTLLTTSHCLLNRHPDKDRNEIEGLLQQTLGIDRVLWLDHGSLGGDDTDSHIDNLARFVSNDTIVYTACNDKSHPDYDSLYKMQSQLETFTKVDGTAYRLIPIYLPSPVFDNGDILPASYVNFLVINNAVLVPAFGQATDDSALAIYKECFPHREVIGINSIPLIKQFGGIHCATMQFPDGVIEI